MSRVNVNDIVAGVVLIIVGLSAAFLARTYPLGTVVQMGPGYFPVFLGIGIALFGAAICVRGILFVGLREGPSVGRSWRGLAAVVVGVVGFALIVNHAGFVLATLWLVVVCAVADRRNTLFRSAVLAAVVCVLGVSFFAYVMKVQIPLFVFGL